MILTPKNVTPDNPADDMEPRYSPDGKSLAFIQQRTKFFYADRGRLMVFDRASGRTLCCGLADTRVDDAA